jgi:hypothetical protein
MARYTRYKPINRPPPQVVAESNQPSNALMEFVARGLERDGFDLATQDWPRLTVDVAGEQYTIGVGCGMRQPERVARALRSALALVESP